MSILASELVWRKSSVIANDGTNGDVMSSIVSTSGAKNNIFPDVPQSERTAGSTVYRKMFIHVANDDDLTFVDPQLFVETRTPGDDAVNIFLGTQTDTESAITGTEQLYGMGTLESNVSVGAGSITVDVEDWVNLPIFANGMTIRISDKADINDTGNEEYHVINGAPSATGNSITLTLTGTLANGYSAGAKVSSVIAVGDVEAVADTFVNNGTGTFSVAGIVTDHIGTVEDNWTITFTSATAYDVSGARTGAVGSGNVGSDFSPNNPNYTKPYFTLLSASFGGTFTAADTITFSTHPAAIPVWYRRDIPAGAASLSGNSVIVAVDGESA